MKKEESSWDFKGADTKEFTHCIHTYPAMMIPQIARRLISLYGSNAKVLLDPFCGSGTSLIEASLTPQIEEAYGFDLNPLAILISKVKVTPLKEITLKNQLDKILNSKENNGVPDFKNIEFWFKPNVIKSLAILKTAINKIKNKNIRNFFLVCFSETVRNTSNTRNSEFKLYRIHKDKLEDYNPDVFGEFKKIAEKNINGMKNYFDVRTKTKIKSKAISSMKKLPIPEGSVDIIVTSPPYGDSITTVAYGQFSKLALQWMGYDGINKLDSKLLGGKASKKLNVKIKSPTLKKIIKKISEIDEKRAREVLSFYNDFNKCVKKIDQVMAKNGFICFVVGNRTVKGINILTDKIISEMFMAVGGYEYITTYSRAIPNKRMPKINSPTNIKGQTSTTMCKEFIFVLQKL